MTPAGKLRVHPLAYAALGLLVLALIGGSVLLFRWQQRSEEKQAFVLEYQGLMRKSLETYYFGSGELPGNATQLVASDVQALRSPDVVTGWSRHDLVSNKIDTRTATPFEREMFDAVMRDCQPLVPQWQAKLAAARQPLLERAGNLAAQLDLFAEPSFNNLAGIKFLEDLADEHQLGEAEILALLKAARWYKGAKQQRDLPAEELQQYQTE
jgi:hypothetical protein